jgi:hypothetical protein
MFYYSKQYPSNFRRGRRMRGPQGKQQAISLFPTNRRKITFKIVNYQFKVISYTMIHHNLQFKLLYSLPVI